MSSRGPSEEPRARTCERSDVRGAVGHCGITPLPITLKRDYAV